MKRKPDRKLSLMRRSFDYIPPAGFDPLTASQDELAKYRYRSATGSQIRPGFIPPLAADLRTADDVRGS